MYNVLQLYMEWVIAKRFCSYFQNSGSFQRLHFTHA